MEWSWFGTLLRAPLVCNCSDTEVMSQSEKIIASPGAPPQCGAFILASSSEQTSLASKHGQGAPPTYFSSQRYPLTSGLSGGSCVATTPRLLAPFEFWLCYLEERRRLVIKRKQHPMRSWSFASAHAPSGWAGGHVTLCRWLKNAAAVGNTFNSKGIHWRETRELQDTCPIAFWCRVIKCAAWKMVPEKLDALSTKGHQKATLAFPQKMWMWPVSGWESTVKLSNNVQLSYRNSNGIKWVFLFFFFFLFS